MGPNRFANVTVEVERKLAIEQALELAIKGDVVLILGKGHETGQEINGIIHPFDDREIARELIGKKR
jgi:UDP-N-acetylmuramoyl-L-alanyl-D-glutamate--2,6-diaminopimelate ligase